jgi:hypothetical protein
MFVLIVNLRVTSSPATAIFRIVTERLDQWSDAEGPRFKILSGAPK